MGLGEFALVRGNTGFKAIPIPGVVYGRTVPLVLNCGTGQNLLPPPSEGLKMESVFPLDVHRVREFCTAKNEGAVKVQTQSAEAEDPDPNEIDLMPKEPPMTVAAYSSAGNSNHCDPKAPRISRGHRDPSHHHHRSERIPPTYVRGSPAQSSRERVLR